MLKLTLFGQFSIKTATKEITEESLHAPRIFRAMIYLFANRNRRIPLRDFSAFLHEGTPASYAAGSDSLVKTTIHRIRTQLKPLQEEEPHLELIVQDGAIRFSPDLIITSDADRFDEVYTELLETQSHLFASDPDRALFLFKSIFSLYQGKYLSPVANEEFAAGAIKAYHDKYLSLCEEYFPIYYHAGKLDELIRMASEGIAIDPYAETFHYFKIRALAERGERALALSLYEGVERLFDSHFHVRPSAKFRKLRNSLTLEKEVQNAEEAFSALTKLHKPNEPLSSDSFAALIAFIQTATISCQNFILLTINTSQQVVSAETTIKNCLNAGEFFCQFSNHQFAILSLTNTMDNLQNSLHREGISFTFESFPISSVFSVKSGVNN